MTDGGESMDQAEATSVFSEHRDLLNAVAYRILGRVADAEDAVQEAWLRWSGAKPETIADPRAFLVRVTTRLAIDRLRRIKARREAYVGSWLPEPMLTTRDVAEDVVLAESIAMAMLVVLETLSPLERAVFVLREAFALPYSEIAEILERSESAVRQVARRAREHVNQRQPRFDTDHATRERATERFLAAGHSGNLQALMEVLAPGVTLISDGGGRARAPMRPIVGADRVARFFLGVWNQPLPDVHFTVTDVNAGPGIVVTSAGVPVATAILDVAGDGVQTIYLIANPDKFRGVQTAGRSDEG